MLREISRRYNIPLEELRRHAGALRDLKVIDYGEGVNFKGVVRTDLGEFISNISITDDPTLMGTHVRTRRGVRPFGAVVKDLRKTVLRMIANAESGHLGASLSVIDILAILYFIKMQHDPSNPGWEERDRLILSKGHAAPGLYAVLAECGYFDTDQLMNLRSIGCLLQGHPDTAVPGVDAKTGSLGQGLSVGIGMAIAAKLDKSKHRVYVVLGDGELNEGQVWEAAQTAAHHRLDNLVVIVDRNRYQLTGATSEVKSSGSIADKWESFGWNVVEVNGHDVFSVLDTLEVCAHTEDRPSAVIAKTTKGKGISFMEGNKFSRSVPNQEQLRRAIMELDQRN